MIGPERKRPDKVAKLVADAQAAERLGFSSLWVPQLPDGLDALTAIAMIGAATSSVEIGSAVMPIQTRHPIAMAQQALATQEVCEGRFTLGLGPSHHWIVADMLGLEYGRPARLVRDYLAVLNQAFAGPGRVDVDNDSYRVHNDLDVNALAMPVLVAALAPVMLRIAGEMAAGTILWMADERAIGDHIVPRITKAAADAGRPSPRVVAGVPVVLCADGEIEAAKTWANQALGHAEYSPNYERLLEHGDAAEVGDVLAAGSEAAVIARLRRFRDAGVTDLAVRVLPMGRDRDARIASKQRTETFAAALREEFA
jgi:F420-dependent oxidoreductase-like protein